MEFRASWPAGGGRGRSLAAARGHKQRALLAVLLLHANEVVSSERLIDELWGEAPPATVAKSVQVYVSGLRKQLRRRAGSSRARPAMSCGSTRPSSTPRASSGWSPRRRSARPGRAAEKLREALALWRGPPLADLAYEPFAQAEIARLEELRLGGARAADRRRPRDRPPRRAGRASSRRWSAEHPLRERLRGQLMLALYRSGRQAEALEAYQAARSALVEELGIEPGRAAARAPAGDPRQDPRSTSIRAQRPARRSRPERSPGPVRAALRGTRARAGRARGRARGRAGRPRPARPARRRARHRQEPAGRRADRTRARARGARVLVGRCWEAGGAPAYWPWVQSLRAYVRDERAATRCEPSSAPARRTSPSCCPSCASSSPTCPSRRRSSPRARAFACSRPRARSCDAPREAHPLVLVLDDLHAADEPSLLLLRFVAREIADSRAARGVRVPRRRPDAARPADRGARRAGARAAHRARSRSPACSEPDVGAVHRARHRDRAAARPARARRSTPRPRATRCSSCEVVRLLDAEGRLAEARRGTCAIPPGVRAVIGQRVAPAVASRAASLLVAASVLGREFGLDALARLSGLPRDELLDAARRGDGRARRRRRARDRPGGCASATR